MAGDGGGGVWKGKRGEEVMEERRKRGRKEVKERTKQGAPVLKLGRAIDARTHSALARRRGLSERRVHVKGA